MFKLYTSLLEGDPLPRHSRQSVIDNAEACVPGAASGDYGWVNACESDRLRICVSFPDMVQRRFPLLAWEMSLPSIENTVR